MNANVDPAYQRFVEMGTTPDIDVRASYLQSMSLFSVKLVAVLTRDLTALVKVVDKGTQFDAVVRLPEEDTYAQLIAVSHRFPPFS